MTVWFTSDHHLQHRAMAWMREYGTWPTSEDRDKITPELVAKHDQMLADKWDSVVTKDDTVWVLGDLVANSKHLPTALQWIRERPGTKHKILGNHDPAHPMHKDAHNWLGTYLGLNTPELPRPFVTVQQSASRRVAMPDGSRQMVLLSHFPYTGDGDGKEDRCSQWRLLNEGLPVLHGHVHSKDKVTYGNSLAADDGGWFRPMQIHVGLDAWDYLPVSLDQIVELMEAA